MTERVRSGDTAQARNDLWRLFQVPDLASVREPEGLARLPAEEARAWTEVWSELEDLCEQTWPAYGAYRRGTDYEDHHFARENAQRAVAEFQQAVELDPGFGVAYASLAYAHLWMYWEHGFGGQVRMAREALDKAVELEPYHPKTHWAEGFYAYYVSRDYDTALTHFSSVERMDPNNSEAIAAMGFLHRRKGDYEQAADYVKRAIELNPRDNDWAFTLGQIYRFLRRYPEAELYFDRAIEQAPEVAVYYLNKMRLYLNWDEDTSRAREVLEEASEMFGERRYVSVWNDVDMIDGEYQSALERLAELPNTALNYLRKARLYALLDETRQAGENYDAARLILERRGLNRAGRRNLAFAYAGLGRKEDAIRQGKAVVELLPISRDALAGVPYVANLAWIYTQVGEHDAAIERLEYLLSIPSPISIALLRTDPKWDPLRHLPRFQKLVEK